LRLRESLPGALLREHAFDRFRQIIEILERFCHEIPHAGPQGLDDRPLVAQPSHHDHGNVVPHRLESCVEVETRHAIGQTVVQNDQVRAVLRNPSERVLHGGGRGDAIARSLKLLSLLLGDERVILDDQN